MAPPDQAPVAQDRHWEACVWVKWKKKGYMSGVWGPGTGQRVPRGEKKAGLGSWRGTYSGRIGRSLVLVGQFCPLSVGFDRLHIGACRQVAVSPKEQASSTEMLQIVVRWQWFRSTFPDQQNRVAHRGISMVPAQRVLCPVASWIVPASKVVKSLYQFAPTVA